VNEASPGVKNGNATGNLLSIVVKNAVEIKINKAMALKLTGGSKKFKIIFLNNISSK
jgi:hypothetical protein